MLQRSNEGHKEATYWAPTVGHDYGLIWLSEHANWKPPLHLSLYTFLFMNHLQVIDSYSASVRSLLSIF